MRSYWKAFEEFHMSQRSDQVTSGENLAIGIVLIIWSINCAIFVSNNLGTSFLHPAFVLLLVGIMFRFPMIGAYFIGRSFDSK